MSEPKGPFDAAITTIRWSLSHFTPEARKNSEQAIRVLEAAGKVDKAISLEVHNRKPSTTTTKEQYTNACRQISALLESLPDKEKK